MKNHCTVSSLCFISKIVEQVVASQVIDHIKSNGLDNQNQSAYKVGRSIETALLSIQHKIHLCVSKGEASASDLLGQSASCDTTDHSTLPDCLQT